MNGYDNSKILLETGTFECNGRTFEYDGEPITVGDLVDNHRVSFKTVEGNNGSFHITETHHIMIMVHSLHKINRFGVSYSEIVYAPLFDEIYATAEEFIESMVEIANTYYDPAGEIRERVEYSSYKGRLLRDMVNMSKEELEAIDSEDSGAGIPASDVESYIKFLKAEGQDPKSWARGVTITEENVDYHIRSRIDRGIKYCEIYCSPSINFFKLAQAFYKYGGGC